MGANESKDGLTRNDIGKHKESETNKRTGKSRNGTEKETTIEGEGKRK